MTTPRNKKAERDWAAIDAALLANFTQLPKSRMYWIPDHCVAVNYTLMGTLNLWRYSLMTSGSRVGGMIKMYQAPKESSSTNLRYPEGIIVCPGWVLFSYQGQDSFEASPETIAALAKVVKNMQSVKIMTSKELDLLEQKAHVQIPDHIRSKLITDAPKLAVRRAGVDRLRVPNTFFYFDGRKPVDIGNNNSKVER